ncbi:MAG: class I SAM-dependent DNA methyltransferase [Thermodesulfobacteriota bacterium]
MESYEVLARFYDPIMGDQIESSKMVHSLIKNYNKQAKTVLELACGTGSYIQYLSKYYEVSGLDSSSAMLSVARDKIPQGSFYYNDMLKFDFNEKFDSIICMNDSVNHLLTINEWKRLFSQVYKHLNKNGVFIFDINTESKLENLSNSPPVIHEFDDNIFITDVVKGRRDIFEWNLRVFERVKEKDYRLYEETLLERALPVEKIKKMLSSYFKKIKLFDFDNTSVSKKSKRVYFVAING